jgi:hypothetical protein
MTERYKQMYAAYAHESSLVLRHHFILPKAHGGTFSAIAPSRQAALRVMDAEKPGCSIESKYDGSTVVPCRRERTREEAKLVLR